ncbi:MAG: D-glycero-beta-D-manno-heptose-7-phosphate kinase [Bacteroidetes bacterium]|nr:D-glycero-beta-D-manno-heptose-7-phosphate kinase [Bacteroidota bacterium]
MLDAYWWGHVKRISPEAPVPVVLVNNREYRLGGAANVAVNIRQMGATPLLISLLGQDADGHAFLDLLDENSISKEYIFQSENRPTTVKSRIIANDQQQLLRVDSEITAGINKDESDRIYQNAISAMAEADALIFVDYDKGLLSAGLIRKIIKEANKRNIPVIVDPKKENFLEYKNATLFKPNLKELREGLGLIIPKPLQIEDLREAAQLLFDKMHIQIAFITLSSAGVYINDGKKDMIVPSHKRSIYDVSGAGDTVGAIAALAISSGIKNSLLAQLTNIAGGLVCEQVGVVPIDREQYLEECLRLLT